MLPPGFGFARGGLASFALFPHTPKPTPDLAGLRLNRAPSSTLSLLGPIRLSVLFVIPTTLPHTSANSLSTLVHPVK
jgi:hypothetical protein